MSSRSPNHCIDVSNSTQAGSSPVATTPVRATATRSRTRPTTSTPGATAGSASRAASDRGRKGACTSARSLATPTTANPADRKVSLGHFAILTKDVDDMNLLQQMIRISCHCNLVQLYVKCGEWNRGDVGNEEKERLACCQNQCPKTMKCGHR